MPKSVERSPFRQAAAEAMASGEQTSNANNASGKPSGRPREGTQDWGPAFIEALMEGCNVAEATQKAGVVQSSAYRRRQSDESFRRAWNEACDIGTRLLEQEAQRRAYRGVDEPVFYKGAECGVVRKYSDTLLIFLLKARKPQKYREGAEDVIRGNTVININVETVEKREELHLHAGPQALEVKLVDVDAERS